MRPSPLLPSLAAAVLAAAAACANDTTAPTALPTAAAPATAAAAEVRSFGGATKGTIARLAFTDKEGDPVKGAVAEFTAYPGSAVQFTVQAVDNGVNDLDPALGTIRASLPDAPWGSIVGAKVVAPYYVPALASLISGYGVGTVPAGAGSVTTLNKHTLNRMPFIQASYTNPGDYSGVAGAGLRVYRLPEHTLVRDVSDGGTADHDKRPGYVRVHLDLPGTYKIVEKVPAGYTPIGETAVTRTLSVNLMAPVSWLLAPTVSPK